MIKINLATLLFSAALMGGATGQTIYTNTGNNTTGFVDQFSTGHILTDGTYLVEATGGTWDTIPVTATGNFQISFQVYNDTYDGDSHFLLLNQGTDAGVDVRNSPEGTDTTTLNIFSGSNFTNYNQFFFPTSAATLASAQALDFPNQLWTQVTITLKNGILSDDVGGQTIQANVSGIISGTLQLGLGGYATTYNPNPPVTPDLINEILYRNLSIVELPEPHSSVMFILGLTTLIFSGSRCFSRFWGGVSK